MLGKNESFVRPRPKTLRALGVSEPPLTVTVDDCVFERVCVFKHDSWAATAHYASKSGRQLVCKFNRTQSIGPVPMRWLGRFLAHREHDFLNQLRGVAGIPNAYRDVIASGKTEPHAVAHDFVEGNPLSLCNKAPQGFFDRVEALLAELHDRRIAYVDLHKQENVIVGDDGLPYLIDFQVSIQCSRGIFGRLAMHMLQDLDLFNVSKHRRIHGENSSSSLERKLPWWLNIHRAFAVPFRTMRRNLLVLLRVRAGGGRSSTEVMPEIGLRRVEAL
jgi:hypothetical protein